MEGESPVAYVLVPAFKSLGHRQNKKQVFIESGCLRVQPKVGGILHLKLNMDTRPIANKYREGKMQRTLKRELKVRETVEREANETTAGLDSNLSVSLGIPQSPFGEAFGWSPERGQQFVKQCA